MILGVLLALAAGGLFWLSYTEKTRLLAHYGYAIMSLAIMFSAFRRMVYEPNAIFAQIGLDRIVCGIFFVGAMLLVANRIVERRAAKKARETLPKGGAWLILPLLLLLMAGAQWSWNGERSDQLTYDQCLAALDDRKNVPAAAARARQLAGALIDRLHVVVQVGTLDEAIAASTKLHNLKLKLDKTQ